MLAGSLERALVPQKLPRSLTLGRLAFADGSRNGKLKCHERTKRRTCLNKPMVTRSSVAWSPPAATALASTALRAPQKPALRTSGHLGGSDPAGNSGAHRALRRPVQVDCGAVRRRRLQAGSAVVSHERTD